MRVDETETQLTDAPVVEAMLNVMGLDGLRKPRPSKLTLF